MTLLSARLQMHVIGFYLYGTPFLSTVLVGGHVEEKARRALEDSEGSSTKPTAWRVRKVVAKMNIDGIRNSDENFSPYKADVEFYHVHSDDGKLERVMIPIVHLCIGKLKERQG
jgi:hypothetical protein